MKHGRSAGMVLLHFLPLAAVSLASFFGARGLVFWLGPKVEAQILLLGGR